MQYVFRKGAIPVVALGSFHVHFVIARTLPGMTREELETSSGYIRKSRGLGSTTLTGPEPLEAPTHGQHNLVDTIGTSSPTLREKYTRRSNFTLSKFPPFFD